MKSSKTTSLLLAGFFGFALAACSPMSDNSLLSDKRDDSSTLTVDKTPKSEELFLKLDVTNISQAVTASKLEIGGECYISTYPNHRILAYLGNTQLSILDISASTPITNQARCYNGRFNFSVDLSSASLFPANVQYTVRVVLQAFDGTGAGVTNDTQGVASIKFTKAN